ncbi:hypothetical protein [Rubritalea marina]|uniref:hypothetical protein n=1 Tax=Rubritalea marina TaxID=361055 RepID=UPI00039C277F|nr:hypothetical protein [Rubritalea marina]
MRNKKQSTLTLPAVEGGWQRWECIPDGAAVLLDEKHEDLPESTCVGLPSHCVVTIPLRLPVASAEVYRDAALLELETLGLLDGDGTTSQFDILVVEEAAEHAYVAVHCLMAGELDIPEAAAHARFDVACRHWEVDKDQDVIGVCREHGQWVLLFFMRGELILSELCGASHEGLGVNLDLMIDQLSMRGFDFHPSIVQVLGVGCPSEAVDSIGKNFAMEVLMDQAMSPKVPEEMLHIEPLEATAIKAKEHRQKRLKSIGVSVAAVYLMGGLLIGVLMLMQHVDLKNKQAELERYLPGWQENEAHFELWSELDDLVTPEWPLALYAATVSSLDGLKGIEFDEVMARPRFIEIRGSAARASDLNVFKQKLRVEPMFEEYDWLLGQPKKSSKTQRWEFKFRAQAKQL